LKPVDGRNSKFANDGNGGLPVFLHYYSESHVNTLGGKLVLSAAKVNNNVKVVEWMGASDVLEDGFPNLRQHIVSSGQVVSKQKFKHGIYEIRAKIPDLSQGEFPALWLYGGNNWANELDFMEISREVLDNVSHTLSDSRKYFSCTYHDYCCNDYLNNTRELSEDFYAYKANGTTFENEWHTFTTKWDEYKIEWYIDGQLLFLFSHYYRIVTINLLGNTTTYYYPILTRNEYIYSITLPGGNANVWRNQTFPKQPQNLILDLQIKNVGGAIGSSNPPATLINSFANPFEIDYVKIYQNKWCYTDYNNYQRYFDDEPPSYIAAENVYLGENDGIKLKVRGNSPPAFNKVSVVATNRIVLGSGFSVDNGAKFHAKIEPCATANYRSSSAPEPFLTEEQAFAFRDSLIANLELDSVSKEQFKFLESEMVNVPGTTYNVLSGNELSFEKEQIVDENDTIKNEEISVNQNANLIGVTSENPIIIGLTPNNNSHSKKDLKLKIAIYPNPNNGEFVLELSNASKGNYILQITDAVGRSVVQQNYTVQEQNLKQNINLQAQGKGIYFVKINSEQINEVRKVVVE
jgi:beta-glucanase (GH16 family)